MRCKVFQRWEVPVPASAFNIQWVLLLMQTVPLSINLGAYPRIRLPWKAIALLRKTCFDIRYQSWESEGICFRMEMWWFPPPPFHAHLKLSWLSTSCPASDPRLYVCTLLCCLACIARGPRATAIPKPPKSHIRSQNSLEISRFCRKCWNFKCIGVPVPD